VCLFAGKIAIVSFPHGNLASIFLVLVPEFEAARLPDVVNVTKGWRTTSVISISGGGIQYLVHGSTD